MAEPTTSSPREGTSHQDPSLTIDEQQNGRPTNAIIPHPQRHQAGWLSRWRGALLTAGFAILVTPFATVGHLVWPGERAIDPTNYALRTKRVLEKVPLIDGHNDLPWMIRVELHNRIYDGRFNPHQRLLGHTDISRLREGMVGGQFWSVYVHCDSAQKHFEDPSWIVRDTLEQIDITKRLVSEYSDVFTYCDTPACARAAHAKGRIASMIGIEGGHQLGGSLGALRQAYELGARYITTTHNCDNAWATAASTVAAGGVDHGLSTFGAHYVKESNRLGMMIDLSHVSHQTMRDVLSITEAPVIFSHSGAYSVTPHLRNVPDDVLRSVKKNGGIVMAVFVTRFLNMQNPESVTIHDVVDHIWHLAEVAGWDHVGIGSDFSGTPSVPTGLEDVSKFPHLLQIVMERGATDEQIRGLAGDNLLRVWGDIQRRAKELQNGGSKPVEEEWEGREWHHAYKSSPYMLRETRERAAKEDWGEPNQFNVKRGQNGPVVKEDKHL